MSPVHQKLKCPTCDAFVSVSRDGTLHKAHICRTKEERERSEEYRRGWECGYKAGLVSQRRQVA